MLAPLHKVVFLLLPAGALHAGWSGLWIRYGSTCAVWFMYRSWLLQSIVNNIWDTYELNSMKIPGYFVLFTVFVLILAAAAGCTTPQKTDTALQSPSTATAQGSYQIPLATRSAQAADIDTTINVRFNDIACLDVQQALGITYLYPDQKFKLSATSPGAGMINVNVLFVDENDQLGIRQIRPQWDVVRKVWVYEGIVPVVQFNDITNPVEKTFTIKSQSKYYICADDRKESGTNDITYRVPVKLTRL